MSQLDRDHAIIAAVDANSNNEPQENSPPCPQLIADCWNHIFDLLSLRDIIAMSKTCKHMQQTVGQYVLQNFRDHSFGLSSPFNRVFRADFCQYISKLTIFQSDHLDQVVDADTYSSLKTIIFKGEKLRATQIKYLRNVLKNIEDIRIDNSCVIGDRRFKQLHKYCPKLKYLKMDLHYQAKLLNSITNTMLTRYFPALENLQYNAFSHNTKQNNKLKPFLEKHTKLKHFGCNALFLWANRDSLMKTNIQLDSLTVNFDNFFAEYNFESFKQFKDFVIELYERGFYKTLHSSCETHIKNSTFKYFCNVIDTLPAIEMLNISNSSMYDSLPRLTNLKELCMECCDSDSEFMAKNLISLERLTLKHDVEIQTILPFIRHSRKLKSIKIFHFPTYSGRPILDIFTLNEERKMLANACRVVIYVEEEIYLRMKWKSDNLSLSHIRIKRFDH